MRLKHRSKRFSSVALLSAFFSVGVVQAGEPLFDGATGIGSRADWVFVSDGVMGGVSEGQVTLQRDKDGAFIRMTGVVSTENRGGFIQVRTPVEGTLGAEVKGVRLVVRGNGEPYFVHLRTTGMILPWQYFQAEFPTTDTWRDIEIPFSAFEPSGRLMRSEPAPASVTSVGVVAYGRDHVADIEMRAVGFYK